jgi:hypothetical protein
VLSVRTHELQEGGGEWDCETLSIYGESHSFILKSSSFRYESEAMLGDLSKSKCLVEICFED